MRFLFAILLLLFYACGSDSKSIDDFDPDRIIVIDSSTVKASTVLLDPLVTSERGLSVGRYIDPYLGVVSARAFAEVNLNHGFRLRTDMNGLIIPVEYDSLVFITHYSAFYGDTLREQEIGIYQLKEELNGRKDVFYSNSMSEYESEPLGQIKFTAKPHFYEENHENGDLWNLRIPLSDSFGEKLIDMAMEDNDTLRDSHLWKDFLPGIVLKGGGDDEASILKMSDQDNRTKIRLYYHDTEGEESYYLRYWDFPITKGRCNFTNYHTDRSKTVLAELKESEKDLNSNETDDLTFIQCGTGLVTKIEIPYWDQMLLRDDIGELLKVELELYPLNLSYRDYAMPSHSLNVYVTNEKNKMTYQLFDETKKDPLTSLFYNDDDIWINRHFKIDLTNYLKPMLEDFESYNIQLLILPNIDVMGTFVERIVFTNEEKSDYRFKLKATFKKK